MSLELVKDKEAAIEDRVTFDDFWTLYPKRMEKKRCEKLWARMTPRQQMDAVVACAAWQRVWQAQEWCYLKYPGTWLFNECWTDELPLEFRAQSSSHLQATLPASPERSEMPENVKALLAKLRAK
jgi:hypothetical protein